MQPGFAPSEEVERTCLNQCQFGTSWRKRTAVVSSQTHPRASLHFSNCLLVSGFVVSTPTVSRWPASAPLCPKSFADVLRASCPASRGHGSGAPVFVHLKVSCPVHVSRKKKLNALSVVSSGKRRWRIASFKVGAKDWSLFRQSVFFLSSTSYDMSVRASPLDQQGLKVTTYESNDVLANLSLAQL